MHNLGSARNTSKVMKSLTDYVSSFRDGENVYYLNKEGRERIGANKIRKKTTQARHYIMRNYLYLAYQRPSTWKNEVKIGIKEDKKSIVICDAIFQQDNRHHIIEVDHTQKMGKNKSKMDKYRELIRLGVLDNPKFIWITMTDYKKKQIEKFCKGLDYQIFTIKDFN